MANKRNNGRQNGHRNNNHLVPVSGQWSAANKLIRDGGSLKEYQENESGYKVDYETAMLELARKSRAGSS